MSLILPISFSFPHNSRLIMLAIAIMFADLFLGDLDIGPASSRIYLLGAGSAIVGVLVARGRVQLFSSMLTAAIAVSYLVFIGWALFNIILRGGAVFETVEHLGSTVLYGWLLMVFAQVVIRRKKDVQILTSALAVTALLTAFVATLQWVGVNAAWELGRLLRPDELFNSATEVPGLNGFSIALGYNLLVGGSLFMGIALWTPWKHKSIYLLIGIGVALVAAALIFAVSRSAIGAAGIAFGMFVIAHLFVRPGRDTQKWPLLILAGTIVLAIIIVGVELRYELVSRGVAERYPSRPAGEIHSTRYSLAKIITSSNAEREALWRLAFDSWLDSPIVGDEPAYRRKFDEHKENASNLGAPTAPHNLVLNALVMYGAIGTVIILVFLGLVGWLIASMIRRTVRDAVLGPLVIATSIAMVAFLINAQFHNESFVSGSTLGFWLVAILVGCDGITRTEKSEDMQRPTRK